MRDRLHFLFLNLAHFLDHLFMLVFATVAALALSREWGLSYAQLIPYATPGFVAFGAFALPAGWLADRWSREKLIVVFFVGIGLAAIAASLATTPLQIGAGLFAIGVFAAIYHPVGIALVLEGHEKAGMRIAVNGVWGNLGVAVAALLTGFMIDTSGWRSAFVWPGLVSVLLGVAYWFAICRTILPAAANAANTKKPSIKPGAMVDNFKRVFAIILVTTALGGLVFQSTTFALPKVLAERATDIAGTATLVGGLAFIAFAIGSIGQLIVGYLVDRKSPRMVFMGVAVLQVLFFALMISATGRFAMFAAIGFMVAAFGQIPINDVLIGRISTTQWRSRMLAVRYATTISVMALSIPFIAWIHGQGGFSQLFMVLSAAATMIFIAVIALPKTIGRPLQSLAK